jgi:hypothetical protein
MSLVETSTSPANEVIDDNRLRCGAAIMAAAGIGFIGYAAIFFARNFTGSFLELGIGPHQVDVDRDAIKDFSPSLFHYISHVHIAVAGFIAACGVAVAALSWYGVRRRMWLAWTTAVTVPVLGLAVALPAHYPNDFDTIGYLGLIYADTALFIVGALLALQAFRPRTG